MSQQNVDLVLRFQDRIADKKSSRSLIRDPEALAEFIDPEVEVDPSLLPDSGVHRGYEAVQRWYTDFLDTYSEYEWGIEEAIDADDRVITMMREQGRGAGSGAAVEFGFAQVWTFRDGRIIRYEEYRDKSEALKAVEGGELSIADAAETVRRALDAWNRRDVDAWIDAFAEDAIVIFRPDAPEPGPFRGRAAIWEWSERFKSAWSEHQATVEKSAESGDRVAMALHLEGIGTGSELRLDMREGHLFTVKDRKIARWENFADPDEAFAALENDK